MAETVFMIHGMWGGQWCWENFKYLFKEKGYHCVATTLRYHDINPKDDPDPKLGVTSLVDYVEDLSQEILQLGVKPILIGHSMGGLLAQILGSKGLAKAIVLLTPAAPAGIVCLRFSVMKSFWSIQTKWGFWKKPMRQTFNEAIYSILDLMPHEKQKETYNKFVYESGRAGTEIGYWFFDSNKASKVDETKVTCPVLVVGSAKDKIVPPSVVKKVADKYRPFSTYKEFENHAHWIVAEPGWQKVAEYVIDWVDRTLTDIDRQKNYVVNADNNKFFNERNNVKNSF